MNFVRKLLKLLKFLPKKRTRQLNILFVLGLITSISEIVSIGALLPFLNAISNPSYMLENSYIQIITTSFKITSPRDLSILLSLVFILAIVIANGLRLITLWVQTKLVALMANDLSFACYRTSILQPYSFYLKSNSSTIIVQSTEYVDGTIGIIYASLSFILSFLTLIAILFGLLIVNWKITLGGILIISVMILPVINFSKYRLTKNSRQIANYSQMRIKLIQESIGGIRDILLGGSQSIFLKNFYITDLTLRKLHANNQFLGSVNRPYMEAMTMGAIVLLILFMLQTNASPSTVLTILGTMILGLNRLLPLVQQCYSYWAFMRSNSSYLYEILVVLQRPISQYYLEPKSNVLSFKKEIRLDNVGFRYSSELDWVLQNVNLTIPVNQTIGFFGGSGCGKTTTADLILGLIKPELGELFVDNTSLTDDKLRWAWQKNVTNVPQSIYLSDASIAENIAFGLEASEIDINRVKEAAYLAQIHEFVEKLPNKYQETVGERGVRLSGGQRQRIGIARALYKRASLIIFDEATSALDNETEQEVMDAIYNLRERVTIIIIAHRLSTLRLCSQVFEFKDGIISFKGSGKDIAGKPIEDASEKLLI
ncbi:ABC transporter ATP-binding protein [Prochlorothrix hollandica]|uniref:ABC transporter ATP-binding protein n=1 Tax=Prochlorothrix hollandica TaxID=1223 RepID=UPI00034B7317|nr:ABC transporter ATP-binding protein [Prochlorothrix hollandica]